MPAKAEIDLADASRVPAAIRPEIGEAVDRIRAAGARGPLDFVGAGMYGIVVCDREGKAWKAARLGPKPSASHVEFMRETATEEYEWLVAANDSAIDKYVPEAYAFHPDEIVVERECVFGRPGGWADESALFEIHKEIERAMVPLGWNAPEFKGDSYVIRDDGLPKLVDLSLVQRLGMNLARFVDDVLEGRRTTRESWHDLAFFVLREIREGEIPEEVGRDLVLRLAERDPSIRKGFSFRW